MGKAIEKEHKEGKWEKEKIKMLTGKEQKEGKYKKTNDKNKEIEKRT